jgi:cbb3-type cytochrome oxidase cytochrome c subunit
VASYRAAGGAEFVQLEPTIALFLKQNESAHPRLATEGVTARWEGYLNLFRPGAYRFSVQLRGRFRLQVAGKEVLAAEVTDGTPLFKEGPETQLQAGIHPLVAEFSRVPGSAQVELSWHSPFFRTEPIGYEVLGHLPAKVPPRLSVDRELERGRFLVEECACTTCHQSANGDKLAKTLRPRQGPDLSNVGSRLYPGWIAQWLENPHKVRPGAVMPRMFADEEAGRIERSLVTHYLASLGGPVKTTAKKPNAKELRASVDRGEQLFTSTGCIACHGEPGGKATPPSPPRAFYGLGFPEGAPCVVRLTGLGSKLPAEKLSAYLENPLTLDPSGRMPNMQLNGKDSQDLARYLCQDKDSGMDRDLPTAPSADKILETFRRLDSRAEELAAFRRLPLETQLVDLGKRLVIDKGCNHCHKITPQGQPFASVLASASFDDIKKSQVQGKGCLAAAPEQTGKAPWFALPADGRKSLSRFLQEGTGEVGSIAPAHAARVALQRYNCLACHQRDGEGGLTAKTLDELRKLEKVESAEAVNPPPLTGVGHKLRTSWLRHVLTGGGRARPWMGLRMPQFGGANISHLPEAIASLEGIPADNQAHKVPLNAAKLEAGRALVGRQTFGCISCHDIAGIANTGTRGPDLAIMNQRVRYEWYRRWLELPQRIYPGTRMPIIFSEGKSPLPAVLGGNADAQAEAMWAYLSLGPSLPLPEGLEPPKGLVLRVTDKPIMLRTFMPDAGSRAIAIGYPKGISMAFDAATCRLAYAWSGNFLDASPVWDNRGGNPAKLTGSRFWTSPAGCPVLVTASEAPPDFQSRRRDPAYGANAPDDKYYGGPRHLVFERYTTDKQGVPTFHYRLNSRGADATPLADVEVSERPEPLSNAVATGVKRHFDCTVPGQHLVWILAGECREEPRVLGALTRLRSPNQPDFKLDLKSGVADIPSQGQFLVLPQGGDKIVILATNEAPAGSRWHLAKTGNTWQVFLRLPRVAVAGHVQVAFSVWAPYRDDPELVKDLISKQ